MSDIEFAFPVYRHNNNVLGGVQYLFKFGNGYGASVIRHQGSYGHELGLWELAFIKWSDNRYKLEYNDYYADVKGWLNESDLNQHLRRIAGFTAP